ncbi:MAG: MaoC family dehydratase [Betaproteobacteria bacterium]
MNDSRYSAIEVGARFERQVTFDAASIRHFAELCGDANPLHRDDAAAAKSTFGTLIASGPHVTALMMGLDATYFTREHEALGLGFEFRFVRAVPAGVTLTLEWTVTGAEPKSSLEGDIVAVDGRAVDAAGNVYVTGHGTNLVRAPMRGDL